MLKIGDLEARRIAIRDKMVAEGTLLKISTMHDAITYGDDWQRAYSSMEAAYHLACAQRDASELLLRIAQDELARVMGA